MGIILKFLFYVLAFILVIVFWPIILLLKIFLGAKKSVNQKLYLTFLAITLTSISTYIIFIFLTYSKVSVFENIEQVNTKTIFEAQLWRLPQINILAWYFVIVIWVISLMMTVVFKLIDFFILWNFKRNKSKNDKETLAKYIRDVKFSPSDVHNYIYLKNKDLLKKIYFLAIANWQRDLKRESKSKNSTNFYTENEKIGHAGELIFKNYYSKNLAENKLIEQFHTENSFFKGVLDFKDKDFIYEVKTTRTHKWAHSKIINDKWIMQLCIYMKMENYARGKLVIYHYLFSPKFVKEIEISKDKNQDVFHKLEVFEQRVQKLKADII